MSSPGSNTPTPQLDEQMKHEAQPLVQGPGPAHVEERRQTVAHSDDTDSPQAVRASGIDGRLKEASDQVASGGVSDEEDRS